MNVVAKKIINIFCVINAVVLVFIFGLVLASVILSAQLKSKFSDLDFTIKKLPHKYAPLYDQPHTIQGNRGTCWAHGLVAGLAHSYRKNGLEKGYLTGAQYVPFSVQAFAIMMIRYCQLPKYNESVCRELQAGPEIDSTEGGEVAWLYYMPEMYDKLFPLSLCGYIDDNTNTSTQYDPARTDTTETEWKCDGLAEQIDSDGVSKNPVRFNITGMTTTYNNEDTKKKVFESGLSAPISIDVWMNHIYVPCPASNSSSTSSSASTSTSTSTSSSSESEDQYSYLCSLEDIELTTCPASVTKINSDDMCYMVDTPGYNLDGEWYQTTPYTIEGGHCMMIQAYNDEYVNKNGDKGGFAIKNSWYDLAYSPTGSRGGRGSHSMQYLMNEISEQEERFICPNVQNPDNWLSCSEYTDQSNVTEGEPASVNWCVANADEMLSEAKWNRRPMAFRDYHWHNGSVNYSDDDQMDNETTLAYTYYLDELIHNTDGTITATMIQVPINATDDSERQAITIRQVPQSYLAWFFQPVSSQNFTNDDDNCGVYWLPYSCNQNTARDQDTWNACFFDIDWEDSSYLANKADYSGTYDYQYLEASQTTRNTWSWLGPVARAAPDSNNPDVDS